MISSLQYIAKLNLKDGAEFNVNPSTSCRDISVLTNHTSTLASTELCHYQRQHTVLTVRRSLLSLLPQSAKYRSQMSCEPQINFPAQRHTDPLIMLSRPSTR